MGIQPPEDIIDAEILPLIRLLNAATYLETTNSCSGYSDVQPTRIISGKVVQGGRSDGVHRRWIGSPYISFRAIGNRESRGKCLELVDCLIDTLVFHNEDEKRTEDSDGFLRETERWRDFRHRAEHIGLTEEEYGRLFPLFLVNYYRGFTLNIMDWAVIDTINGQDIREVRTPDEVMKVWKLLEIVAKEFIDSNP